MSKKEMVIRFGHSGEVKLIFESQGKDTSVKIEGTNFGDELFWITRDKIEEFTEEFNQLIQRYFI
jgi:hypothetical protein